MPRNWVGRLVDERPLLGWPVLIAAVVVMLVLGPALIAVSLGMAVFGVAWTGETVIGDRFYIILGWALLLAVGVAVLTTVRRRM